jgi:hypothetical protein
LQAISHAWHLTQRSWSKWKPCCTRFPCGSSGRRARAPCTRCSSSPR